MLAWLGFHRLIQRGQQGSAAPIVHHSIPSGHMVVVSPHDDDFARGPRQQADHVWQLRSLYRLLGKVLHVAPGFRKKSLQGRFALLVGAAIFPQSRFHHRTCYQFVSDGIRRRSHPGDDHDHNEEGLHPRNPLVHPPSLSLTPSPPPIKISTAPGCPPSETCPAAETAVVS